MMPKEQLEQEYAKFKITEIAALHGVTRPTIYEWLRIHKIPRKARYIDFVCDTCKKSGRQRIKDYELSMQHFCCHSCYMDYMRNDAYVQSRTGQRIARKVLLDIAEKKGLSMPHGFVAHHKDGDERNNDSSNLVAFKTKSEHLAYHHQVRRERLSQCTVQSSL